MGNSHDFNLPAYYISKKKDFNRMRSGSCAHHQLLRNITKKLIGSARMEEFLKKILKNVD